MARRGEAAPAAVALEQLDPGLALAYLAFMATTLGWALWVFLLERYPAAVVAPFSMLVPVFGLASAALLLDEPITARRVLATALIVGGVLVALRGSRLPTREPAVALQQSQA